MLLVLRWSGLRVSDAAKLGCDRLEPGGSLRLYTQKTGSPVTVKLPPYVVKLLGELYKERPHYFFWNGTSNAETPGKAWWKTLKYIFKAAGIPNAKPHMLRDTFAVEMLLSGCTLDKVSTLLGHSSVKITEKHYLPWVKERQAKLDEAVELAWAADPLIAGESAQTSATVN
jgi:integrase/recombinase XerD